MAKLSSATANVTVEASDSTCINYPLQTKVLKHDSHISPSRFKGVVGQPNGRWGAQIYGNHQRVWLGTFKSENEAAMAYDSAAIKLRNGESYRNFPWTSITHHEPNFQSQFTTEAILNMIKDGSYPSKFDAYLKAQSEMMGEIEVHNLAPLLHGNAGLLGRQLFQKELTPSDVGKLNRLVIPKKNALKYFPNILDNSEEKEEASGEVDNVELVFYDGSMRLWRFRYCYWKSSQSFVFTKGWNKFVRDKELKAKDTVIFSLCGDGLNEAHTFFMIDVCYCSGGESTEALRVGSRQNTIDMEEAEGEKDLVSVLKSNGAEKDLVSVLESNGAYKNGLRLFGVQIM